MSAKEMIPLATFLLVVVVIFRLIRMIEAALVRSAGKFSITFDWRGILKFVMVLTGLRRLPPRPPKGYRMSPRPPWRALLAISLLALVIGAPVRWWKEQPQLWRGQVANAWDKFVSVATHDPHDPEIVHLGGLTRAQLKEVVDLYTDRMRHDPFQSADIWVLDHYWQYWNTPTLDEYMDANKMFVASGGRIHRMFLLTGQEMQDPAVQSMLRRQCQIGRRDADQTGNGFELWRADPQAIRDDEAYQAISRSFRQLPEADRSFEDFDVVQFHDALYYSADFSLDHRALGRSVWLLNPDHVSKVDLRPLFRKSIAERVPCDQPVLSAAAAPPVGQ